MTTSYVVLSASLNCIEPLHALLIDILPRDMSLQDEPIPKDGGVVQNATNYNWSKSRHGRGRPGNVPWFLSNHLPTFPSFLASRVSSALNGVQLINGRLPTEESFARICPSRVKRIVNRMSRGSISANSNQHQTRPGEGEIHHPTDRPMGSQSELIQVSIPRMREVVG
jgi:hypothetical protein